MTKNLTDVENWADQSYYRASEKLRKTADKLGRGYEAAMTHSERVKGTVKVFEEMRRELDVRGLQKLLKARGLAHEYENIASQYQWKQSMAKKAINLGKLYTGISAAQTLHEAMNAPQGQKGLTLFEGMGDWAAGYAASFAGEAALAGSFAVTRSPYVAYPASVAAAVGAYSVLHFPVRIGADGFYWKVLTPSGRQGLEAQLESWGRIERSAISFVKTSSNTVRESVAHAESIAKEMVPKWK